MEAFHALTERLITTAIAIAIGAAVIFVVTLAAQRKFRFSKAVENGIFGFGLLAWTVFCLLAWFHK
ncbi:hypothetical protein FACS189441_5360 [Betaproteobacteria bacterium]|nr:hypothetical protein FACS189441_5360 [Betaproteobacteria bacterium]